MQHEESVEPERHPGMELIENLEGFVEENLFLLAPVDQAWQPTDYLPDLTSDDWAENLARVPGDGAAGLRRSAGHSGRKSGHGRGVAELYGLAGTHRPRPDRHDGDSLGAMAAGVDRRRESARRPAQRLPAAHGPRGHALGRADHSSSDQKWLRARLGARVRGADLCLVPGACDPDHSRQRRPSWPPLRGRRISPEICRKIAGDETRHETFYTRVIGEVMERDPEGGVLAYRTMLRGKIAMPGKLMFDGHDPDLYDHFGAVTQRNGAYTFQRLWRDHQPPERSVGHRAPVALGQGGQGSGLYLPAAGTVQTPGG